MRIGTLYFDTEKLKEWTGQTQQTMALFEKIRTVGKGLVKFITHSVQFLLCNICHED